MDAAVLWIKNKDSPLARAMRTMMLAFVGLFGARETLDIFTDFNTNGKLVAIQAIAIVIAGGIAYLQAYLDILNATTPFWKMVKQFLQLFIAGAPALVVADLTGAAALDFVNALWSLTYASFLSALAVLFVNVAEDKNV